MTDISDNDQLPSNDVVERIKDHSDADACQRTLDLLSDAAAEIQRLRAFTRDEELGFERWCSKEDLDIQYNRKTMRYQNATTRKAWSAWLARSVLTLPPAHETECARCKEHEQFRHQHRDCDKLAVALQRIYLHEDQSTPAWREARNALHPLEANTLKAFEARCAYIGAPQGKPLPCTLPAGHDGPHRHAVSEGEQRG
jgi:hypothetical protein